MGFDLPDGVAYGNLFEIVCSMRGKFNSVCLPAPLGVRDPSVDELGRRLGVREPSDIGEGILTYLANKINTNQL